LKRDIFFCGVRGSIYSRFLTAHEDGRSVIKPCAGGLTDLTLDMGLEKPIINILFKTTWYI